MNTIILFSIILGSVLYVVLPFLRKKSVLRGNIGQKDGRLADLYDSRDNLLIAIKDLELDREMGKISDEDFTEIGARYRREAMGVLKDIDSLEGGDGIAQETEELIRQRQKRAERKEAFCSACGAAISANDRFCGQCGQRLLEDSL